ncbi:MAG: tRNA (adenosine(37)-N6)-threonylcarbamoyltransferase complex transferase subunit TsaD [Candidatus Omnitrophica bacterium]|nr:tRNA (adenosine(37)-N6)-threonylcarbamoyltransferase complex transferase subunit TsaD [Candidatus Omnitrophota bacterium]
MPRKRRFLTLGIETSCDETACAVLENDANLLSSVVASSLDLHKQFGGVVPEIASRHCLEYIRPVYDQALKEAGVLTEDIDLIGVTYGPGLVGSLLVGLTFAKALSYTLDIPFVGVNHLEGHLYANFIRNTVGAVPYVGLIVSGGHTSIVYSKNNAFTLIGETRDDAVGEAFDKVAKMLNLGYPGGPIIEKKARFGDPRRIKFTCATLPGSLDFSFSGIKTAVLYYIRKLKNVECEVPDICAAFQDSVVRVIVDKIITAARERKVTTIVVGGGVSANQYLRDRLTEVAAEEGITVLFPMINEAIDNGAMIARCAYSMYQRGKRSLYTLSADPSLSF